MDLLIIFFIMTWVDKLYTAPMSVIPVSFMNNFILHGLFLMECTRGVNEDFTERDFHDFTRPANRNVLRMYLFIG